MRPVRYRGRAIAVVICCSIGVVFLMKELVPVASTPYDGHLDSFKPVRNSDIKQHPAISNEDKVDGVKKSKNDVFSSDKNNWKFKRRMDKSSKDFPDSVRLVNKRKQNVKEVPPKESKIYQPANSGSKYPILKNGKFVPSNRIFHIDLKGGAPRLSYFELLFPFLKKIGATGILMEWEDMFPYEGLLESVRSQSAYTKSEVHQILTWANQSQLDIIALVQTFGHLEWILKYEQFAKYRQVDRYPQVICLSDTDAVQLVKTAVDQVLSVHKQFPTLFFHIGADEAFQVGMCPKDVAVMQQQLDNSRERLMLSHISSIAKHVRHQSPSTSVLIWHDMLNNLETTLMNEFKLGELVEPVVWNYAENLEDQIYPDMWDRFGSVFPFIWGASAYKGADGPSRFYSNVPHYLANHRSWISQMTTAYKSFKQFRGLIFTGWQRFDHFAVLCELLPIGLVSATVNFAVISRAKYDRSVLREASTALDCSATIDIDSVGVAGYCNFPGHEVYESVQQLRLTLDQINENVHKDYQVHGWLSEFNKRHNYSQAWYLDQLVDKFNMHISDLESIAASLRRDMSVVFFMDTVDEFLFEYVEPEMNKLLELLESAQRLATIKTYPQRPIRIRNSPAVRMKRGEKEPKFANE